ncbi:MAG: hypothetical protein DRQ37_02085 [Gammaproteobacteria bacterium]|nr:MAG: hypothetical protein DRQ37_02085 [Gammaproteobacteria bacterium]
MTNFFQDLLDDYHSQIDRHNNRPFMEAAMAACSLVAIADGEVSLSERIRVDQILETLDELKVFDPHEAVDIFNEFNQAILKAPKQGREKAIEALRAVSNNQESASLLIRICVAISEAEGGKSLVDQIEIVMLCSLLGVKPEHCGLYVDDDPTDILAQGEKQDTPPES